MSTATLRCSCTCWPSGSASPLAEYFFSHPLECSMLSRQFIAKTRRLKGFIVSFQWVNGEPAMCLLRQFMGTKSAFVICLSAAYKYAEIAFLVPQSARIAAHFGMKGERQ